MNIDAVLVAVQSELMGSVTSSPAGLGKALPKQANKGSQPAASKAEHLTALCQRLTRLLQADEDCSVYLRESQGLASLMKLLSQVGTRQLMLFNGLSSDQFHPLSKHPSI